MNKQRNQSTTGRITEGSHCGCLCGSDHDRCTDCFWSGPVPDFEALCVLPYFLPSAVPGVTIGCFLANLLCGAAPLDVVFGGSIATLIGAVGSIILERRINGWYACRRSFQYHHRSMGTALCIWLYRPDPYAMLTVGIGEIWLSECWVIFCFWHWSGITERYLHSKVTAFPYKRAAGLKVPVRSRSGSAGQRLPQ